MKSKIYIDAWLKFKPYNKESSADIYYLKICNRIREKLSECESRFDNIEEIDAPQISGLACLLTAYFEDLISGTNIWNTFIKLNKRHYGKPLPFYECQNYIEEEINFEDVRFLIWYYFQLVNEEYAYSPFYIIHSTLAIKVMEVFEEEWEYAPENEKLLKYYQIDENERDFYVVREAIQTVLLKTYLFHFDTALSLFEKYGEIIEEFEHKEHLTYIIQDATDNFVFKTRTKLLALKGQEWLAEILTDNHPLYNDILNISDKISSPFLYTDSAESHYVLEHIASGKVFNLTKKSIQQPEDFDVKNQVFFLGIVRWMEEWWFSGIFIKYPNDEDTITEERNSLDSRKTVNFLDRPNPKIEEILIEKQKAFLEFNNGSPIAFMRADKVPAFVDDFLTFYNRSLMDKRGLTMPSDKNEEAIANQSKPDKSDYVINADYAIVFFNVKSGVEIVYDLTSAFPLPENPFVDEDEIQNQSLELLEATYASTELTQYFVEHCSQKIPYFVEGMGRAYLEELDFMLRFWKSYNYETVPEITI